MAGFLHLQLPFILEHLDLIENGANCNKLKNNFFKFLPKKGRGF